MPENEQVVEAEVREVIWSKVEEREVTKFNPENKETLTYGESLGPAMSITDQDDADQYFKEYVTFLHRHIDKESNTDDMIVENVAKVNLSYYAGYFDLETRIRVEKLFSCSHPIFGRAKEKQPDNF